MQHSLSNGVWPTMVTIFKEDGSLDFSANAVLTRHFINQGANGLFAVCMSSEMFFLNTQEKVDLAVCVVEAAEGRIPVVASGHTSDSLRDQVKELSAIATTGVDAVVLVSNRCAAMDEDSDKLFSRMQMILNEVEASRFGLYECPYPFLRLLTLEELTRLSQDNRMAFVKDVSCDPVVQQQRAVAIKSSQLRLFNAQTATMLDSLRSGYAGYSGVMGNYHIDIYRWLQDNWDSGSDLVSQVQEWLTWAYTVHQGAYPISAKYHLGLEGLPVSLHTRSKPLSVLTADIRRAIDHLKIEEDRMRCLLGLEKQGGNT
jgi:4-hydroxy-tetrahydrodipicolinate synthase